MPDVAEIACDADGARATTLVARPQADGIHIAVTNESDLRLSLLVRGAGGGGGGRDAPPGRSEHVFDLPPGEVEVGCYGPGEDGSELDDLARVSIADEEGLWVSTELTCGEVRSTIPDWAEDTGERGEPVELAEAILRERSLRSSDTVEPAGYPEAEGRAVRVVRDGETVATLHFRRTSDGGLLLEQLEQCTAELGE